ncbi:hypothetical protein BYT27DRAFT_7258904 [Phlegmacium glaucopus]|nr:hypothetical protein BYT27DRAFT_7258904 [Phlegmacium glaucopus]
MKRSNPPHNHIRLYCSQPSQTQAESEAELSDFPPIREGNSKPLFAPICTCPQAAQEASQPLPVLSRREAPPLSQRRQQSSAGLGQSNILNTVSATAPARRVKQGIHSHPGKSVAKRPGSGEDADDERPLKKQHLSLRDEVDMVWVQDELTGFKEGLERIATEAREDRQEINGTLQELLDEIRQKM